MDIIREWAFAVCVAAVAGSIMRLMCPAGEVAKIYKVTVSVFLLCCILAPVLNSTLSVDWGMEGFTSSAAEENTGELKATLEAQVEEEFISSVKAYIESEITAYGASAEKIYINVNRNEDGGIFITELNIFLSAGDEDKQAEISKALRDNLGIEPAIQFRQEVSN